MTEFEYVVIGAGSAGCVVAARLAERGAKVALLEAGGSHRTLKIHAPGMYFTLWRGKHDWAFLTEPQAHVDGRRMYWPRGKVVGGSGSLNASLYVRGHRDDYDAWRDAGATGWGWDDVKPFFERSLSTLSIEEEPPPSAAAAAFVEALCAKSGVARVTDFNAGNSEGAGHYRVFCKKGERWSTARAFLDPARGKPNLTVITGAHVQRMTATGSRVDGVEYRVGGSAGTLRATKEIILCAGAIGSPQLLQLSGIGPAAHLREVGVDVVHDLPAVGENLQDHLLMPVTYAANADAVIPLSRLGLLAGVAKFLAGKKGPFARSPIQAGGFVKLAKDAPRPDLQFHFAPLPPFEPNFDDPPKILYGAWLTILPTLIYPKSRGTIRLRSKDPSAPPAIDPRYLSAPEDLETLLAGVKLSREIAAHAAMRAVCGAERNPGADVQDDDALRARIRRHADTIFHPVGTCAIGAVVDAQLRVRGVDGLRVADASVMPTIIGGNTNAPTIMIAEKCAELIA